MSGIVGGPFWSGGGEEGDTGLHTKKYTIADLCAAIRSK